MSKFPQIYVIRFANARFAGILQIAQADAASRSLDRQLQEVTAQLKAARQEHAETVSRLHGHFNP